MRFEAGPTLSASLRCPTPWHQDYHWPLPHVTWAIWPALMFVFVEHNSKPLIPLHDHFLFILLARLCGLHWFVHKTTIRKLSGLLNSTLTLIINEFLIHHNHWHLFLILIHSYLLYCIKHTLNVHCSSHKPKIHCDCS